MFSSKPTVEAQVKNLIRKSNKRFFALLKYKRKGIPNDKIRDVYCSVLRSVMEFSSVVYHSLIPRYLSNLLESIQKRTLRAIYGYNKSYTELLAESGIKSLADRREEAIQKFAERTLPNPVYASWFNQNENRQSQRHAKPYEEKFARTNRLYNSPLFTIRRNLNLSSHDQPQPETSLDHNLNDPFTT